MSLFWSQWMDKYWNRDVVDWLVDDWRCDIVRAAMGIETDNECPGYLEDPEANRALVRTVIEAAINRGIYVIVDWHDHNASQHLDLARAFFDDIAREYGSHPNILYEIFNEPVKETWPQVKAYSEDIVAAIRRRDPHNLILVGSSRWSQDVDVAAADPLEGANLAYTLHYYAGTHREWLRDKAALALDRGVALFASEWGLSECTGDGPLDHAEAERWFEFLDRHAISWCNWSLADKWESSAALMPGAPARGGWTEEQLTASGRAVRRRLRGELP